MATLKDQLAQAAQTSGVVTHKDEEARRVDLDLIDDNPLQPRTKLDPAKLKDLMANLAANGQLQPIIVRATAGERFVLVAGQRRVAAHRSLRDQAQDPAERKRWSTIKAEVRIGIDDTKAAAFAHAENHSREGLTPVEEGVWLDRLITEGHAQSNEDLAELTKQPVIRVQRLRRIGKAPKVIRDSVDEGIVVVVGKESDGTERRERRSLDLMAGLEFAKLFDFLFKEKPKKAEERTENAIHRALAQRWSLRRTEDFVKGVLAKKHAVDEPNAADDSETKNTAVASVFERTPRRFVVDLGMLPTATAEQLAELRAAVEQLIATRAGAAGGEGQQR